MFKIITLFLVTICLDSIGQNGYVKLDDHSKVSGYLKYVFSNENGELMLEFWRSKKEKEPISVSRMDVFEYAINKDTFRIFKNYHPFYTGNFYYELVEAKVVKTGKLDLLKIPNNANPINMYVGAVYKGRVHGTGPIVFYFYLIDSHSGEKPTFILPKNEFFQAAIKHYFKDIVIEQFIRENGDIKYNDLEKLVEMNNSFQR